MMRGSLLFSHFLAAILAFYVGSLFTAQTLGNTDHLASCDDDCVTGGTPPPPPPPPWLPNFVQKSPSSSSPTTTGTTTMNHPHGHVFPVAALGRLGVGAAHIARRDFMNTFPMGIPLEDDGDEEEEGDHSAMPNVLLLYPTFHSLADDDDEDSTVTNDSQPDENNNDLRADAWYPRPMTAQAATANCRVMKVILTQPSSSSGSLLETRSHDSTNTTSASTTTTCIAIMVHQLDSYHIQKYVRQPSTHSHSSRRPQQQHAVPSRNQWQLVPWQYPISDTTAATLQASVKQPLLRLQTPPKPVAVRQAWQTLQSYLAIYPNVVQQLRPLVEQIVRRGDTTAASSSTPRTRRRGDGGGLIVMVCNYGHVELLVNFYCAARAIGMDLSRVLLFATDVETFHVARQQLGGADDDTTSSSFQKNTINVFYHEGLFSNIPTDAATTYGSLDYAAIMMSKVYVAHLLTLVGEYDFLFHDVDIVPYRPDYLDHLLDKAYNDSDNGGGGGFDMYFQYDHLGGPVEYQPWYANSGFYLVRHNARTRYFFSALARQGDLILRSKSHQTVVTALLNEHVNLYGLRVKVLQDEADLFPGGFHFHKKWDYMKAMMRGEVTPFIMHMNYNDNKETKRKFNEQIGNWFVQDSCIDDDGRFIILANTTTTATTGNTAPSDDPNLHACCIAYPKPKCYYRDKPSKIPCREFPRVEGGDSFW